MPFVISCPSIENGAVGDEIVAAGRGIHMASEMAADERHRVAGEETALLEGRRTPTPTALKRRSTATRPAAR